MPLKEIVGKITSLSGGAFRKSADLVDIAQGNSKYFKYSIGNSFEYGKVSSEDWYKVYPYQLVVVDTRSNQPQRFIYTLPIPPEALSMQMVSASGATATLGGVVEEVSENIFWNIQLSGTTGMALGRSTPGVNMGYASDTVSPASFFRTSLTTTGLLAGIGAGVQSMIQKVSNIQQGAMSGSLSSVEGFLNGVSGALQGLAQPPLPYSRSGVNHSEQSSNGHSEILQLQRFLHAYSVLKGESTDAWQLWFFNHKDDCAFRVVIQGGLSIQKSVQEPYLYRYRLTMRGWDIRDVKTAGVPRAKDINRYETDLKTVNTLTLTGIASTTGKLAGTILGGPKTIGGALNVIPKVI